MARGTPYEAAVQVLGHLRDNGHEAWIVGGAVRDHLLGQDVRAAAELDVTTDAVPERVFALFRRTLDVGKAFGVVRVGLLGQWTEVATFRSDGDYADGRHPTSVSFGSVQEDVLRRDFTINGVLWNPLNGEILDLVGGVQDIHARRVRAIGDARERLREDGLRLLRAVRFGCTGEFHLEEQTLSAVREESQRITAVSPERIRDELHKIATRLSSRRGDALCLLRDSGLLVHVLPQVSAENCTESAMVLDRLAPREFVLFLATVLRSQRWLPSADIRAQCEQLAQHLRLSRAEAQQLAALLRSRRRYRALLQCSRARQVLAATREDAELHEALLFAEGDAGAELVQLADLRAQCNGVRPVPLVDGVLLQRLGMPAGPCIGHWLRRVRWAQLEGRLDSKDSAIAWLQRRGALSSP
ncbi:MAG: CCA tRNA nucleotidyltransferase [Planctomycetes bacterium]|nr:CCA tRNA nucleotidyltransferase [Planctomycetota bacterium]